MNLKKITINILLISFFLIGFTPIFADNKVSIDPGSAAGLQDEKTPEEKSSGYDPLGGLSPTVTNPTTTTGIPSATPAPAKDTAVSVPLATSPAECGSQSVKDAKGAESAQKLTPRNCLFLEEPIGGKTGYDLYVVKCIISKDKKQDCDTTLWRGESISAGTSSTATAYGPIQAILTEDKSKPYYGPFTLLYNYLNLIYSYMSGLIVGISVLFVVIGGIQMTISSGDTGKFDEGKKRIIKALVGIVLWFTASLILYTINPTFFSF